VALYLHMKPHKLNSNLIIMKRIEILIAAMLFITASVFMSACNKDEDEDDSDNKSYALVIDKGAQSIEPGESVSYSAKVVDTDGNVTQADNITWSVTPDSVGSISNGVFSTNVTGKAKITASATVDGTTVTTSVPIGVYQPSFFAVAPAAILFEANHQIDLNPVYFGQENPTFSYNSSDNSVASVNSNGVVDLIANGECVITVTASNQTNRPVYVPIMVIGPPTVNLPITRIELNSYSTDLFKDETKQLSATAYNPEGAVNDANITWASANTDIATVSSDGLISPVRTGKTFVTATALGVFAQCEVLVNPDTIVLVEPLYKDMQQGETHQFVATAYKNQRNGLGQTYDIDFNWVIPDYGPGFEMFNIATVDNNGNVTVKQDAMMGMSTILIAYDANNEYLAGGAMIMVDMGLPF